MSLQQMPALEKHPEVLPRAAILPHRPKLPALRLLAILQRLQGRRLMMVRTLPRSTLRLGRGGEERSQEDDGKGSGKEGEEDRGSRACDEAEMQKNISLILKKQPLSCQN